MVKRTGTGQQPRGDSGRGLGRGLALGSRTWGFLGRILGNDDGRSTTSVSEATSIAVVSGKGGTGKSFVATSMAVVLHQRQHQVTLVDCDFGLACDHLLLGVTPKQTLQHVLAANAQLSDIRVRTPAGPQLVPGGSGILKMADLSDRQLLTLSELLGEVAATEDVMLLDVGAGIAPQNMLTLLAADHVVVVTLPEIAALTDAYAVIKCSARLKPQCRFSVVVNRVMAPGQGRTTFDKLAEVASRHAGVELLFLGEIREDPTVTQRRLGQLPLVATDPTGDTACAIHAVVDRLTEVARPLGPRAVDHETGVQARFREHRLFLV